MMTPQTMKTTIKRKEVTLRAIRPNAGVAERYRAELNRLLRSVRNEVLQLVKTYGDAPHVLDVSGMVAKDAAPLVTAIEGLMISWISRLDKRAETMARKFVKGSVGHYDANLRRQLRDNGFTVELQMTDFTKAALQEAMGENIGLIKSIPQEYLGQVSKYANEAIYAGFDLATLTSNLEHAYHIGRNRAKLIARDQSNKANSVIEKARRMELGITRAVWQHSGGAKKPRPSHVAANGKEFDIAKGCLIDGEYIQAGQLINCGCVSRSILPI